MSDEDLLALVADEVHQPVKLWELLNLQVCPGHKYLGHPCWQSGTRVLLGGPAHVLAPHCDTLG